MFGWKCVKSTRSAALSRNCARLSRMPKHCSKYKHERNFCRIISLVDQCHRSISIKIVNRQERDIVSATQTHLGDISMRSLSVLFCEKFVKSIWLLLSHRLRWKNFFWERDCKCLCTGRQSVSRYDLHWSLKANQANEVTHWHRMRKNSERRTVNHFPLAYRTIFSRANHEAGLQRVGEKRNTWGLESRALYWGSKICG